MALRIEKAFGVKMDTLKGMQASYAVPPSQLEGIKVDGSTAEAIADWHHWVAQGYYF